MKKLLLAAVIAYFLVYGFDIAAFDSVHWHFDSDSISGSASDFLISGLVMLIVGVGIAALLAFIFATGLAVALCVAVVAGVSAIVGLGMSLAIPIALGAGIYWLCRSKPIAAQHTSFE